MFKMGCSKAKKILALDGSKTQQPADQTAKKGQKLDKLQQQPLPSASKRPTGEELNDFSKLQEDHRIPLNVRQIFKITKSWKAIARTMSKTGTAMFLNLFEQNQDLFYLFDRFQHLKGEELHESMELREHAATVMSTLDQSINSLSDYDNFVTYLHSIGELHRKVPGFRRLHFWKIEQPFLKAVKQTLDERCNETIEEIYKIAIKLIIETIAEGYGEDSSQQDSGPSSNKGASNGDGSSPSAGPGPSDAGGAYQQFSSSNPSTKGQTSATGDNLKSLPPASRLRMQVATRTSTSDDGDNLECRSGGSVDELGDRKGVGSGIEQAGIKLASIYPLSAHSASSLSSSTHCRSTAARYMMRSAEVGSNMGRPANRQSGDHECEGVSGNSRTAMQLKRSLFVLRQLLGSQAPLAVARRRSFRNTSSAGEPADDEARRRAKEEEEEEEEEQREKREKELAIVQEPQRVGAPPPSGRLINCQAGYGEVYGSPGSQSEDGCKRPLVAPQGHQSAASSEHLSEDLRRTRNAVYHRRFSASPFRWRRFGDTSHETPPPTTKRSCNANERRPNKTLAQCGLSKLLSTSSPKKQLSATECSRLARGSCTSLGSDVCSSEEGLVGYSPARAPVRPAAKTTASEHSGAHSRLASACRAHDEQMCGCSGIRTQQREDEGPHLSGTREAGSRSRQCSAEAPPTRVKQSSRGHSILMSLQRLARTQRTEVSAAAAMQQQHSSNTPSSHTYHKSTGRAKGVDLGDVSELIKALMQALSVAQRDLAAPLPVA